jgi:hypothetical protein
MEEGQCVASIQNQDTDQREGKAMTTLTQKINEITDRVLNDRWECDEDVVRCIKSAIYAGIEEALKMKPSEEATEVGVNTYEGYQSSVDRGYSQQEEGMRLAYDAMRAAQWAEIQKEIK